jgi:hypothetical protein
MISAGEPNFFDVSAGDRICVKGAIWWFTAGFGQQNFESILF